MQKPGDAALAVDELGCTRSRARRGPEGSLTGILGSAGEGIVVADHTGRLTVFNAPKNCSASPANDPGRWSEAYVTLTPTAKPASREDQFTARALREAPTAWKRWSATGTRAGRS